MSSKLGSWCTVAVAVAATWGLIGCAGSASPTLSASTPNSPPPQAAYEGRAPSAPEATYGDEAKADSVPGGAAEKSGAPATASPRAEGAMGGAGRDRGAYEPPPENRPGLGTAWGETRESRTTSAPFVRDSVTPFAVSTLWYNDRAGAQAMARWADYRGMERGVVPVRGGALTVSLRGEQSQVLPGFFAGGKQYVVGEAGTRYIIVIENHTGFRFECVASVDGLDVIDGLPAAYTKRGYLVQPYGVLEIDGYRRSSDAVAAFRFSSVRGSYSSRSGQGDRNVGVIGVAFFNEDGTNPTWSPEEVQRRHQADPFPGGYAQPPRY